MPRRVRGSQNVGRRGGDQSAPVRAALSVFLVSYTLIGLSYDARGTYNTNVSVDSRYSLVGVLFEEFAGDELFEGEDDPILAADADGGAAVLDGLHGVFDLEVAAIGGEDGVGKVVACTYGGL